MSLRKNKNVVVLDADLSKSTKTHVGQKFPDGFINVGIAEQNSLVLPLAYLQQENRFVSTFAIFATDVFLKLLEIPLVNQN